MAVLATLSLASCSNPFSSGDSAEQSKTTPTAQVSTSSGETLNTPGSGSTAQISGLNQDMPVDSVGITGKAKEFADKNGIKFETVTINGKKLTYVGRGEYSKLGKYPDAAYAYLSALAMGEKPKDLVMKPGTVAILGDDGKTVKEFHVTDTSSMATAPAPNTPSGTGSEQPPIEQVKMPEPKVVPCNEAKCSDIMEFIAE